MNNSAIVAPEPSVASSSMVELKESSGMSLRTLALAAVASSMGGRALRDDKSPEASYLLSRFEAVDQDRGDWPTMLDVYLSDGAPEDLPLIHLAEKLNLTLTEVLTVALAAAVEEEVMIGRALAYAQAPVGASRPTFGLLTSALREARFEPGTPINTLLTGVALRTGLLTVIGDQAPMPERAIAVPLAICLALAGRDGFWPGATIGLGEIGEVPLPRSIAQEAEVQAAAVSSSTERTLVIRTGSSAEARSVASLIARTCGRRPLFIEGDKIEGLVPWLILRELLPVFCFELGPGERKAIPSLPFYDGPVLALCGPDGSVGAAGRGVFSWSLPVPSQEERKQLWERGIGAGEVANDLARYHRHGSGRIAHLSRLIEHRRLMSGNARPSADDIAAASWVSEGAGLDALAQPLTDSIDDEALVMTPQLRSELDTLLLRCRCRDSLVRGLGASATARYRPGVRALLVGSSGTGKTLAASWLASKLRLPLYRVDLASVTSKYIGETEKNLAQLLARAEQAEVVLLFDEADSMFGKRTDVKDANDRFANAQTNYLLQRIEFFDGITLLTSNSRSRFDSAFSRRLDMIIEFPAPGPEERRMLWQSHLGINHQLTQRDLNQLAATADLSGGHVRNAVLTAAVFAQNEGRLIGYDDIIQALAAEYRKLGQQMPVGFKSRD